MIYALLSSLPIVFCLFAMSILKWNGIKSISISLGITIILALFIWELKVIDIVSYMISGVLDVINIILIIFGAMLLLNILTKAGAVNVINNSFNNISRDARVHVLLIGLAFNTFLDGIAAFGTEVVLSTLVLVSLGFPSFPAAIVSLAFNAPFVTFGAVGVPTVTSIALTQNSAQKAGLDFVEYANQVSAYSAFLHSVAGMFLTIIVLFIVIKLFGKEKSWKPFLEIIPFALLNSAIIYLSYYLVAVYLGPELPTVIAGVVGLFSIVFTSKFKILLPKNVWTFQDKSQWPALWIPEKSNEKEDISTKNEANKNPSKLKSWLPYIVCSLILIVSRIPALGVQSFFKEQVIHLNHVFGLEKVNYDFLWLYSPGIMPFLLISILSIIMFSLKTKEVKEVVVTTWNSAKIAVFALVLSVMMVGIMSKSYDNSVGLQGMLVSIATLLSNLQGVGVLIVTPILGALGTFVSGSNTTSNILFSIATFDTSLMTNIPSYALVALQSVGGGAGIMFCFKNLLLVSSVTKLTNREGHILNYMLVISGIYLLIIIGVVFATVQL